MVLATELLSQATLRFALLGAATGALTGLVALSIVIVHRVSGVLNFSAGAFGAVGAFACYSLRDDHGWPALLAVAAGLAVGTVLGVATYGVMALLRGSSLLGKLIATLALLSAAQSAMVIAWPDQLSQPQSLLPSRSVVLAGDLRIGQDRLILIGVALALAFGLRLLYSGTLFGLATAAVSENRRVAAIARWAPSRVEFVNYVIAGALSALAAILLAPIVTLNAAVLSMAVLPALAAALVGRFSSFAATVTAALGIGILQSEFSLFQPDLANAVGVSTPSLTGLAQAVPLLIILAVTVLSGRVRLSRGETVARLPLPGNGRIAKFPLALGIVVAAVLITSSVSYADAMITTLGLAIVIASVVVVSGYAGQLSLCQYALAGFGAWVTARAASSFDLAFVPAIGIGVVATIAVGVLVALPAIRTRGVTLAMVTLALALVFNALIFQNGSMTGGFEGISVDSPQVLGLQLDPVAYPERYALFVLLVLVLVSLVVANLRSGSVGRQMIAVRSNERAAAALGINVVGVKLYAFAVGAGIAALGGTLLAFRQANVQFTTFDVFGSILLVQYAVIGGLGWIAGAAIGASASPGAALSQLTSDIVPDVDNLAEWLVIAGGLGVVDLLRRAPDGVAPLASSTTATLRRRLPSVTRRPPSVKVGAVPGKVERVPVSRTLEARGVSVHFGGVAAVDDVSFRIDPGEVVGLIGPNGAGKTTLLDVITGFTRQNHGVVFLDGTDISDWSPERRARAGLARSWQAVELFDELTVGENLLVAEETRSRWRLVRDLLWRSPPALSAFGETVVDDLGLRDVLDLHPRTLPHGVTKLVGIARTIISNPGVILLDEPAAGLDTQDSRDLARVIRRIADAHQMGIVVIEHDMALILNTCDRIVALDFGRKIADASPQEIQRDQRVVSAYLGVPSTTPNVGPIDLEATHP